MDYLDNIFLILCLDHWTRSTFACFPKELICVIIMMLPSDKMHCGYKHTIFVNGNKIVRFGSNLPSNDIIMNSKKIYSCYGAYIILTNTNSIIRSDLVGDHYTNICSGLDILKVAFHDATSSHYILILKGGHVYSFGYNSYGQLGLGDNKSVDIPTKVNINGAIKVSCGNVHTCLLLNTNCAYMCGNNEYGQLGIATINDAFTFQIINIKNVISIGCGAHFTVLLDKSGDIYFCGHIFGKSNYDCVITPHKVLFSNPTNIKKVKCGRDFIVCMDIYHKLHSWGYDNLGQLGRLINKKYQPELIRFDGYDAVWGQPKVTHFKTGTHHVIVKTIDGTIWGFGSNCYKQLGNIKNPFVLTPHKIDLSLTFRSL